MTCGMVTKFLLSQDLSFFENIVDPDQPSDQDQHCFPLCLNTQIKTGMLQVYRIKIREECST